MTLKREFIQKPIKSIDPFFHWGQPSTTIQTYSKQRITLQIMYLYF